MSSCRPIPRIFCYLNKNGFSSEIICIYSHNIFCFIRCFCMKEIFHFHFVFAYRLSILNFSCYFSFFHQCSSDLIARTNIFLSSLKFGAYFICEYFHVIIHHYSGSTFSFLCRTCRTLRPSPVQTHRTQKSSGLDEAGAFWGSFYSSVRSNLPRGRRR